MKPLCANSAYLTTEYGFTKQFISATMIEVICERINTLFGPDHLYPLFDA